jgi:hypothetical protein
MLFTPHADYDAPYTTRESVLPDAAASGRQLPRTGACQFTPLPLPMPLPTRDGPTLILYRNQCRTAPSPLLRARHVVLTCTLRRCNPFAHAAVSELRHCGVGVASLQCQDIVIALSAESSSG